MKQIVLVIAAALLLTACSKEQPKKVEIRPVRVTLVQHALSGDTISLTGQIQAKDSISLAFRIGGRLQERSVTVGDPVAPGQAGRAEWRHIDVLVLDVIGWILGHEASRLGLGRTIPRFLQPE
jgi:hypothetical protein